jgi:predicted MFS family arabinose efflux permease
MASWRRTTFAALYENRAYRILWTGQLLAVLAFFMSFVAQSVVAFDLEGNNRAVGVVQFGVGIAMLSASPFGGVIADRFSKRRLVMVGQSIIGASMLAAGILIITDEITILFLTASTFLMGLAFSFNAPARQSYIGGIVGPKRVQNAVALSQLAMNASRVGGPLVAGVLISGAVLGPGGTYIVMSALVMIASGLMIFVPNISGTPADQRRSFRTEYVAGVSYAWHHPRLRFLLIFFITVIMFSFGFMTVLPGLLENELGHDAEDLGVLLTAEAGAGLLLNIILAGQVSGSRAWVIMLTLAALLGIAFFLLAIAPTFTIAIIAMLVFGPAISGFMLTNTALIMGATDPAFYGRVMALTMIAFGAQGVLAFPIGVVADTIGERETLLIEGAIVLAAAIVASVVYTGTIRGLPATAPLTSLTATNAATAQDGAGVG